MNDNHSFAWKKDQGRSHSCGMLFKIEYRSAGKDNTLRCCTNWILYLWKNQFLHMAIQTGSHFTLHVVGARVIRMRGLLLDKLVFAVELSN